MDRKQLEAMGEPPGSVDYLLRQADPAASDELPDPSASHPISQRDEE